jgi:hypothetical protein
VECLSALKDLFELDFDPEATASGPAFRTHSKDRSDYSPEQREQDRERGKSIHAREIEMVLEWAQAVAEHGGVPMTLPAPLLS